ncbi:hypothetical protein GCM10010289_25610 [Streptomyces violascens]|uniref:Transcription factor zinc-finger domain-containing protein n=1 Tax=Streptomyces violascens TaxID=67381 RepID=A0ABQ3QI36_9ACTN|nr:hypothetical protein GCM10010289_25610 [Streptomyces violascens]GHI36912.1 hypothetical protein Sviol_13200 [Streptomyces violascens]
MARPAAWFAAGLLAPDTWARFLAAYREGGGPAVPTEGDPWPQLDVPARTLTVRTGALALAKCAERSRLPDEAERAMLEGCTRIAAVQDQLGTSPTSGAEARPDQRRGAEPTMQCPECHAPMRTYNRNGVQIEQCSGCRGIFLDCGELESLTRLDGQWFQQGSPPGPYPQQGYPAPAPPPRPGAPRSPTTADITADTTSTTATTTTGTGGTRASAPCSSPPEPHLVLNPARGHGRRNPRPSRRPGVPGGARYWD